MKDPQKPLYRLQAMPNRLFSYPSTPPAGFATTREIRLWTYYGQVRGDEKEQGVGRDVQIEV